MGAVLGGTSPWGSGLCPDHTDCGLSTFPGQALGDSNRSWPSRVLHTGSPVITIPFEFREHRQNWGPGEVVRDLGTEAWKASSRRPGLEG